MARIHGNRGQILMDPTGGATVVEIASLSEWTLDLARDRVDVTCLGDTNKRSVMGLADYSGTFAGFWDADTTPDLFAVMFGTVAPMLHLVPDRVAPTFLFKGLANIDGSISVSATDAAKISGKFVASDNWVMEP